MNGSPDRSIPAGSARPIPILAASFACPAATLAARHPVRPTRSRGDLRIVATEVGTPDPTLSIDLASDAREAGCAACPPSTGNIEGPIREAEASPARRGGRSSPVRLAGPAVASSGGTSDVVPAAPDLSRGAIKDGQVPGAALGRVVCRGRRLDVRDLASCRERMRRTGVDLKPIVDPPSGHPGTYPVFHGVRSSSEASVHHNPPPEPDGRLPAPSPERHTSRAAGRVGETVRTDITPGQPMTPEFAPPNTPDAPSWVESPTSPPRPEVRGGDELVPAAYDLRASELDPADLTPVTADDTAANPVRVRVGRRGDDPVAPKVVVPANVAGGTLAWVDRGSHPRLNELKHANTILPHGGPATSYFDFRRDSIQRWSTLAWPGSTTRRDVPLGRSRAWRPGPSPIRRPSPCPLGPRRPTRAGSGPGLTTCL